MVGPRAQEGWEIPEVKAFQEDRTEIAVFKGDMLLVIMKMLGKTDVSNSCLLK